MGQPVPLEGALIRRSLARVISLVAVSIVVVPSFIQLRWLLRMLMCGWLSWLLLFIVAVHGHFLLQ
jgi:hypothetical protein